MREANFAAASLTFVSVIWLGVVADRHEPVRLGSMPSSRVTPGAFNPAVMQATIDDTICVPGWSASVRPGAAYTNALKRRQLAGWGYANADPRDYEEDHLVPLELGGAPLSPLNLWPEPRFSPNGWSAGAKDRLEDTLHRLVCSHNIPLSEAREAIKTNWIAAYYRFVQKPHGDTP